MTTSEPQNCEDGIHSMQEYQECMFINYELTATPMRLQVLDTNSINVSMMLLFCNHILYLMIKCMIVWIMCMYQLYIYAHFLHACCDSLTETVAWAIIHNQNWLKYECITAQYKWAVMNTGLTFGSVHCCTAILKNAM